MSPRDARVVTCVVAAAISVGTCFLCAVGSGVMPLPLGVVVVAAVVIGVWAALPFTWFFERAPVLGVVVGPVCAFFVVGRSFGALVDNAQHAAERWGAGLAVVVERERARTGHWPATLTEVRGVETVPEHWLYRVGERGERSRKVAGFFVVYEEGAPPTLRVQRRGVQSVFEWSTHTWRGR